MIEPTELAEQTADAIPTLKDSLAETITWIKTTGSAAQDFATEQVPLYCQEVVRWHIGLHTAFFLILLVLLIMSIRTYRTYPAKVEELNKTSDRTKSAEDTPEFWIGLIGMIISTPLCFAAGVQALKGILAPRLIIIEHLQSLL